MDIYSNPDQRPRNHEADFTNRFEAYKKISSKNFKSNFIP